MRRHFGYLAASLTSCVLFLAACGGGGPAAPAFTPAPAPAAPAATANGGPVSFQPANMTVTYPAAASMGTAVNGGTGQGSTAASGQGATVTLTTDASGNLSKIVLNIPAAGFTQPFDANTGLSSLSSPLTTGTIASLFGGNVYGFLNTTSYLATQSAGTQSLSASAYGL